MTRKYYNKLIRDRIPEIIRKRGAEFETSIMSEEEYLQALAVKLVEEAQEAKEAVADTVALSKEIADIYEVIDALIAAFSLDREGIIQLQQQRRRNRGAFQERLFLHWVD